MLGTPGDVLARGEMFGMIKLGSRTELIIPDSESLEIVAEIGDKICAGSTILGRYRHRLGQQASDLRPDENPSDKSATP